MYTVDERRWWVWWWIFCYAFASVFVSERRFFLSRSQCHSQSPSFTANVSLGRNCLFVDCIHCSTSQKLSSPYHRSTKQYTLRLVLSNISSSFEQQQRQQQQGVVFAAHAHNHTHTHKKQLFPPCEFDLNACCNICRRPRHDNSSFVRNDRRGFNAWRCPWSEPRRTRWSQSSTTWITPNKKKKKKTTTAS